MNPSAEQKRWVEIVCLYYDAISYDAAQRASLLENAEPSLRAEVEPLLVTNERAGDFLDQRREQSIEELSPQS
jgi:hypothetical protein